MPHRWTGGNARLIEEAFALIDSSSDPLAALLLCEGLSRRVDRAEISQIAAIDRDGLLIEKGCTTTTAGLKTCSGGTTTSPANI